MTDTHAAKRARLNAEAAAATPELADVDAHGLTTSPTSAAAMNAAAAVTVQDVVVLGTSELVGAIGLGCSPTPSKAGVHRTGGRTSGSQNFQHHDTMCLLKLVEEELPTGPKQWEKIAARYNEWAEKNHRALRPAESLRKKFHTLQRHAEDPKTPEEVRYAKRIHKKLENIMSVVPSLDGQTERYLTCVDDTADQLDLGRGNGDVQDGDDHSRNGDSGDGLDGGSPAGKLSLSGDHRTILMRTAKYHSPMRHETDSLVELLRNAIMPSGLEVTSSTTETRPTVALLQSVLSIADQRVADAEKRAFDAEKRLIDTEHRLLAADRRANDFEAKANRAENDAYYFRLQLQYSQGSLVSQRMPDSDTNVLGGITPISGSGDPGGPQ